MDFRQTLLLLVFLPGTSVAAVEPWSGELNAGYVATSGNSDSRTTNGKVELVYTGAVWRNTLAATAIQSSQTSQVTGVEEISAERYAVGDKADFNFTARDYAFLALEFEKDLVGPVRERTSETVGYGRKVLTGPEHLLELEIGGGARQTEEQFTGIKASDAIGRGRFAYRWNFTETSHFGETIKAESGKSNTFVESVTELKLSLVGKLFAVVSYTLRQNSDVPVGAKKTDTITTFSLGWSFGK